MKREKWFSKSKLLPAMLAAAVLVGGAPSALAAESGAPQSFMAEVPIGDWSYGALNELITAGKVTGYTQPIPEGYVLSRMEMAAIVQSIDSAALDGSEAANLTQLEQQYYYDLKKLQLLNNLDKLDNMQLETITDDNTTAKATNLEGTVLDGTVVDDFLATKDNVSDLNGRVGKVESVLDRISFSGHGRIRNDHLLSSGGRQTTSNHINVNVMMKYKVNDNWNVVTGVDYRSGMDSLISPTTGTKNMGADADGAEAYGKEFTPEVYVQGRMDNGLGIKAGRWYEWTPLGWGFDMDSDVTGFQLDFGNKLKTTISYVKVDLWDYAMANSYVLSQGYSTRQDEDFFGIRFTYPFDNKNVINFGTSWMTPMVSRFQDPSRKHVMYYYAHGTHTFDKNWKIRAGIMHSDAKSIPNAINGVKNASKVPGLWFNLQYKNIDLQKPGTYDIWATYRREPGLTMPTVTDWWPNNNEGIRVGADYVLDKNLTATTWMTWFKEIDTGERSKRYRFQVDFYF